MEIVSYPDDDSCDPLPTAVRRHPAVDAWFDARSGELGGIARRWFAVMRDCGDDVCELLHDNQPTACVGETAFAYVDAFTAHVNVGFFEGNERELAAEEQTHTAAQPGV